jgi:hypothetical protein
VARKLGELLVAKGSISSTVLDRALELQGKTARGMRLGAILMRWGQVPERTLLESLSMLHRCPAVDWQTLAGASREAVELLSAAQSSRLGAVPYAVDKKSVHVAFANPSNLTVIDEVHAITGKRVIAWVTTEVRLLQAQQRFYKKPLAREVWVILQKLEAPQGLPVSKHALPPIPVRDVIAPKTVPPPPFLETTDLSADPRSGESKAESVASPVEQVLWEPVREDASAHAAGVEDLIEPATLETSSWTAGGREKTERIGSAPPPEAADVDSFHLFLEAHPPPEPEPAPRKRPDPFAHDTPMEDFIKDALSFYEGYSTLPAALAKLDDGPIEDLDSVIEEKRPASTASLDATHPSRHRRRARSKPGLTA